MAKKIVIENQRGVAPEFNLWTMEAVEEMLELFPEFKDKFAVEARGNYRPQGSEIDRDAFENIPDDEKDLYVRLPSGKYLVPYAQPTGTLSAPNSFPATTALIRKNWSSFGPTPTTAKIR